MLRQAKRFYKAAEVAETEGGWGVTLDGRPLKTPAKAAFLLPRPLLAEAVAAEWEAQGERLKPEAMPLTALAFTAIDLVRVQRDQVVAETADFGGTDLLCYRAAHPRPLAERQQAAWQPLLDWAALELDAPLAVTHEVAALAQPAASLQALRRAVERQDDFGLAALANAVRISGSLVIGLALAAGRLEGEAAFAAAELDETYSLERWGEDAEAVKRREGLRRELLSCERFFALLKG